MNEDERDYLLEHRCHDFGALIGRWRAVAEQTGLHMEVLAEADEMPVFVLHGQVKPSRERGLYLSAGVHGDEPGATSGLIAWAERSGAFLSNYPVTIFPCLNPWGLVNNSRLDGEKRDLNRMFDAALVSPIRQWQDFVAKESYRLAICLHEDYDARGAYVYELARKSDGVGIRVMEACEAIIPREPGSEIEGRAVSSGVVTPDREIEEVLKEIDGMPEAIYLYLHQTDTSLTFETPSEYSLFDRVHAQEAVLDAAVALIGE